MIIKIKVVPRSSKNEVIGLMGDGSLKVKLTAPPVDGAANAALVEVLADHYKVPKNKITIRKGLKSKNKVIEVNVE